MKKTEHEGIVAGIEGDRIRVKLMSVSACASCHAKGACSLGNAEEKEFEIQHAGGSYRPGDKVIIEESTEQGLTATWWAYVLPLFLVMATLIVSYLLTKNEGIAGLCSLLILVPYFLVLRACDKLLARRFHFTIKPVND